MYDITGLAKLGEWTNSGSVSTKIFKGFLVAIAGIPTLFIFSYLAIIGHLKFKKLNYRTFDSQEQACTKVETLKSEVQSEQKISTANCQNLHEIKFYKTKDGEDFACDKSYMPLNALKLMIESNLKTSLRENSDVLNFFKKIFRSMNGYKDKLKFLFQALKFMSSRIESMVNGCNRQQYLEVKKFIDVVKSEDTCCNLMKESPDHDNKTNTIAAQLSSAEKFYENESNIKTLIDDKALKINNLKIKFNSEIDKIMQEANAKAKEIKQLQSDIDTKNIELTKMKNKPLNGLFSKKIEDLKKEIEDLEGKLKEEQNHLEIKMNAIKWLSAQLDDENIKNDKDVFKLNEKINILKNDNQTILSEFGVKRDALDREVKNWKKEHSLLKEQVKLQEDIEKILSTINMNLEKIESSLKEAQNALTQNAVTVA